MEDGNMTKIPKNPDETFEEITDDFKKVFNNDLVSIILESPDPDCAG